MDEVLKLKNQAGKGISLGGLSIATTFTQLGLIDEFWFLVQPIVLGKGRRIFEGLNDRVKLKLVDTRTFKSGVIVLHYLSEKK